MKKFLAIFVFLLFLFPASAKAQQRDEYFEAEVVKVSDVVRLKALDGSIKGQEFNLNTTSLPQVKNQKFSQGEKIVTAKVAGIDGDEYYFVDYVRRSSLLLLFGLFAIVAIAIGKKWGVASLLGMTYSFFVIFKFILPRIVAGGNPVFTAVIGAGFIVPVTFYLSHGLKPKTHIGVVSTILSLIVTGLLSLIFINLAHLTGFAEEEAMYLQNYNINLDIKGILLAGIIIGVLGILDDITISQASVVEEIREVNKKLTDKELYQRAMNVGRDHIASLINTLVIVYAGASLPLFLLFTESGRPFSEVINLEMVASEIVRTLVGSIGLILAVPLTTFIAVFVSNTKKD